MKKNNYIDDIILEPYALIKSKYNEGYTHIAIGESHNENKFHNYILSIIPKIHQEIGLTNLCLEIESDNQVDLIKYFKTQNSVYLNKIIQKEYKLLSRGYPLEGRFNGNYFEIIETATKLNIPIKAIDNHGDDSEEVLSKRDNYMTSKIPLKGKILLYLGAGHITHDAVPYLLNKQKPKLRLYTIYQANSANPSGLYIKKLIKYFKKLNLSDRAVAFDYSNPKTIEIFEMESLYNILSPIPFHAIILHP